MLAADPAHIPDKSDPSACPAEPNAPAAAWEAVAHHIAQQPHMRVSRDGGKTYPASRIRRLTLRPPNQPAAVPTYDRHGTTRCVVFDLDAHDGTSDSRERVEHDNHTLQQLLGDDHLIADQSPNGGRHIYLLLPAPAPIWEVRAVLAHLAPQLSSLDPTCMLNPVAGLIRPPGSRHGSGGHQQLITPLPRAVAITTHRAPRGLWPTLLAAAQATSRPTSTPPTPSDEPPDHSRLTTPSTAEAEATNNLSDRIQRLARTGDHTGYRSHSEARQAVITGCVRAGWKLAQLISRIEDGRWPGLAAMYSRYGNRHSRKAIVRDWNKAHSWLPPQKQHPRNSLHQRNTREHKSHPQPNQAPGVPGRADLAKRSGYRGTHPVAKRANIDTGGTRSRARGSAERWPTQRPRRQIDITWHRAGYRNGQQSTTATSRRGRTIDLSG
ncbi:hypothetical protein GCM10027613_51820 [Microlunatus endophyticus]